jgi:2-dehydro-3-deoxyphosphogluconate aldolase/(4S)-4-hydroxy-2-oxoglutarate aldolase
MKDFNFEVVHLGINQTNQEDAKKVADLFQDLFGFSETNTPISIFSSPKIEIMKKKGAGECGHVAIGTSNITEAKKYLESKGVQFDPGTAVYTEAGKLKLIYLKNEIGGFAIHLIQK